MGRLITVSPPAIVLHVRITGPFVETTPDIPSFSIIVVLFNQINMSGYGNCPVIWLFELQYYHLKRTLFKLVPCHHSSAASLLNGSLGCSFSTSFFRLNLVERTIKCFYSSTSCSFNLTNVVLLSIINSQTVAVTVFPQKRMGRWWRVKKFYPHSDRRITSTLQDD